MYSFAFCLFIEERKKKEQKNKYTEKLHRPGIELGTSRSPVLHFTTAYVEELLPKESFFKTMGFT